MILTQFRTLAVALAVGSLLTIPAAGQDNRRSNNERGSENSREQQSERKERSSDNRASRGNQEEETKRQSRSSDQGESSQSSRYALIPEGWLTIGIDTNNDGFYDTFETIYSYDLVQARDASRGRSDSQRSDSQRSDMGSKGMERGKMEQQRASRQASMRDASIQGEITSLRTEQASDSAGQRLIAQVKNSQGRTAEVCLGPKNKLEKLNLEKGDKISAEGFLTRKDNKLVLLAAKVSANDQTVTHQLTKRQAISRVQGELTTLDETQSRRGDGTYLVAKIKTDNQGTKEVHLGPKQQLSSLDLSEGDDVQVLTRTGKIGGKEAMVALEVSANGEKIKVIPPRQMNQAQNPRDRGNR
jgi:hypothetical protein